MASSAQRNVPRIAVMLDWENFPGLRPSVARLPLESILAFLRQHFHIEAQLAYAHRASLSRHSQEALQRQGFELKFIDGLLDTNAKKNSLDLCLAMEAVDLGHRAAPDTYVLLVGGDRDFAVVSAFIRKRLGKQVIAFGSLHCPNPSLAEQVDLFLLIDDESLWTSQLQRLHAWQSPSLPLTQQTSSRIAAAVAELGAPLPCPMSDIARVLQKLGHSPRGKTPLHAALQNLGCRISSDQKWVLEWGSLGPLSRPKEDVPCMRHPERLKQIAFALQRALRLLGLNGHFPVPLGALKKAMQEIHPTIDQQLSKRWRLWHALSDLGFTLSDDHSLVTGCRTPLALRLIEIAHCGSQPSLFGAGDPDLFANPSCANAMGTAEQALAARVQSKGQAKHSQQATPTQSVLPLH